MSGNKILESVMEFWDKEKNNNRLLIVDETTKPIDPTTGPSDDKSLPLRLAGITFEILAKNLASYPYDIVIERPVIDTVKNIRVTKTYYLEDNMKITSVTLTDKKTKIVKTIDATEPLGKKYTKEVAFTPGTKVAAIYKEENSK